MPEVCDVFVYGTLMFAEVTDALNIVSLHANDGVTSAQRKTAVLHGYNRFTVRLGRRGQFPAIVRGAGTVLGQLLTNVTAESLDRMDQFEGIDSNYYSRETVTVETNGESRQAFAYVCGKPLRPYLGGPWDADAFRANELEWYVRNVVSADQ